MTETLELHCAACGTKLTGETDGALATVQDHVKAHGRSRPLTVKHLRARLHPPEPLRGGRDTH